jgi:hypothetical protein
VTDPVHLALAVYKGVTIAEKGKKLLDHFSRTTRFIEERDEMHRGWTAETHLRLAQHIEESRENFLAVGGALEEHQRQLEELFEQHEAQLLAVLYAEDAYREILEERRRMLSFAAASIVDLSLTIEQKARIEKLLRELDPADIFELHKLSRCVGRVERTHDGDFVHATTAALRHHLLSRSKSGDALIATRCVGETIVPTGSGWGGAGGSAHASAYVTERGHLVLYVLRHYVDEKHDAFVGCGREAIPGSRSEVDARKALAAVPGLLPKTRDALRLTRAVEPVRPRFVPPSAKIPPGDTRHIRQVPWPAPTDLAAVHLPAMVPEAAKAIPTPPEGSELGVQRDDLPQYGRPAMNVVIKGPVDLLRWLADDLDARWPDT